MKIFNRLLIVLFFPFLFAMPAAMASSFTVEHIEFRGLLHLQQSTVLSYMPVQVGQTFGEQDSANTLRTLYKTGFFDDVNLQRSGNTLIVTVKERPVIEQVKLDGNKAVDDKKLEPVLNKMGVAQGDIYDPSKLNMIKQGLLDQYHFLGYYSAKVDTHVVTLPRNRVQIQVNITEGDIAKVKHIRFVGNSVFSDRQLRKQLTLKQANWITWLGHKDRYSKNTLDMNLRQLSFFYFDHGYLDFKIISKKVEMSNDNKHVDITVYVSEGSVYTISHYRVQGVPAKDQAGVQPLIDVKPGQVFSRKQLVTINKKVTAYFANDGHALAKVNIFPQQNHNNHTVSLSFQVVPGPMVYVRRIVLGGNDFTSESALRQSMLQMEGGPYSQKNIDESKRRLNNLPYLKDVKVTSQRVPGAPDQVDLDYNMTEVNAGKISAQAGYSDTDGFLYGAGINEPNFMGSGKQVGLNFQNSEYQKTYGFKYTNPYVTTSGISRSLNLFYVITTPDSDTNRDDSYKSTKYGGTISYGLPISLHDRINLGGGYSYIKVSNVDDDASPSVSEFLAEHPSPYHQFNVFGSWLHSTLDRAVFPTKGYYQSLGVDLGVPVVNSSLDYYKLTLTSRYYVPLGYGFVLTPHAQVGYGGGYGNVDSFPFYENFYGGGINTVSGYAPNSLGPKNPNTDDAIGGNFLAVAGVNFVFPNFVSDRLRTSITLAAGNVFDTDKLASDQIDYENISLDNFRASVGLLVEWYSPFGPLQLTVAQALNKKSGDDTQLFDFALGTSI